MVSDPFRDGAVGKDGDSKLPWRESKKGARRLQTPFEFLVGFTPVPALLPRP